MTWTLGMGRRGRRSRSVPSSGRILLDERSQSGPITGPQAHSEVLLAEMARHGRTITETEAFGIEGQGVGRGDQPSRGGASPNNPNCTGHSITRFCDGTVFSYPRILRRSQTAAFNR